MRKLPTYAAVMAPFTGELVLFGGWDDAEALSDTWAWNGTGWTEYGVAGPPARSAAVMTYVNGNLVLFGGQDASGGNLDDTWIWNGSTWTQLGTTSGSGGFVYNLRPYQGGVAVCGAFDDFGGVPGAVLFWAGSTFSPLGDGLSSIVAGQQAPWPTSAVRALTLANSRTAPL